MTLRVIVTGPAQRDLRRLDQQTAGRVAAALERYARTGSGDVRKLRALDEEWRLRVGSWRVRFTLDGSARQMIVLRVLPRGRPTGADSRHPAGLGRLWLTAEGGSSNAGGAG